MDDKEKLAEGERLYNLSQSEDFKVFKDRYEDVILSLADIRNIPFKFRGDNGKVTVLTQEQRTYEMLVRERVLVYMQDIMQGIMADVEEYKEMIEGTKKPTIDNDFVIRFDN